MAKYVVHGLFIETEIVLPDVLRDEGNGPCVSLTERVVDVIPRAEPSGPRRLNIWRGDRSQAWLSEGDGHLSLLLPGAVEFIIADDLSSVVATRQSDVAPDLIPILVCGLLGAVLVSLHGDLAMHASGVLDSSRLLLIAGGTGRGKSTTAALCVLGGGALFADDVVRVTFNDERPIAYRGSPVLRLRASAANMASITNFVTLSGITDRRSTFAATTAGPTPHEIAAVVLPRPSRSATEVSVQVVAPDQAFRVLHRCLRVSDWQTADDLNRQFDHIATLAAHVPTIECVIPWRDDPTRVIGSLVLQRIHEALSGLSGLSGAS